MMVSDPRSRMPPNTFSFKPLITELTVITVMMPITMPRIVSEERSGFKRKVSSARSTCSRNSMDLPRDTSRRKGNNLLCGSVFPIDAIMNSSLRSQRFDRIEFRRFRCRIGSEEKAYAQSHRKATQHRPDLDGTGQGRHNRHNLCNQYTQNHPDRPANHRHGGGFNQKL